MIYKAVLHSGALIGIFINGPITKFVDYTKKEIADFRITYQEIEDLASLDMIKMEIRSITIICCMPARRSYQLVI